MSDAKIAALHAVKRGNLAKWKSAARPKQDMIFKALSELFEKIHHKPGKKGFVIPFEEDAGKFIIFSDQHKGARNGADNFMLAETNYLTNEINSPFCALSSFRFFFHLRIANF